MNPEEVITQAAKVAYDNGWEWRVSAKGVISAFTGQCLLCPLEVAAEQTRSGTAFTAAELLDVTKDDAFMVMDTADGHQRAYLYSPSLRARMFELFKLERRAA